MKGKDLLSISDLSGEDISLLISDTMVMKASGWLSTLSSKSLALLFEKPSLRTRVSFETAIRQMEGQAIYISPAEVGMGKRESVADVACVLNRFVDAIIARTFSHTTLEILADNTDIPVINALSDREHPCQALTDLFTIFERKGELRGLTIAYIGDGNNVAHSLLLAASLAGLNCRIASPKGYEVDKDILQTARGYAADSGARIVCTHKAEEAIFNADVVYTDVWTSMGQEEETEKRRKVFAAYQINAKLFALAKEDAIFMHPLPAHRGDEVTDEVIESPSSIVFDQAENRMHVAKALLASMLGGLEMPLSRY